MLSKLKIKKATPKSLPNKSFENLSSKALLDKAKEILVRDKVLFDRLKDV
ncbi:MAG: hypothetical protein HQK56_15455 [Deltaproteobacteria bacterium]|nr:hypothetical protein [Deltaproteobacteria bacterium]